MTNKLDRSAVAYIGNAVAIKGDDFALPAGLVMPPTISLLSVHYRQGLGAYIGRTWYLQCVGRTPENTIDFVTFQDVFNEENLSRAQAFLRHHGYTCVDEFNGEYRKGGGS